MSRRRLTGAARIVERRRENIEILMGILGFFTLMILVTTAVAELRGEPSLAQALVLAILVGLFYVLVRIRRALVQQLAQMLAPDDESVTHLG